MQSIDKTKKFITLNLAILTVSDSRTLETDKSGDYLKNAMIQSGHNCIYRCLVKDDVAKIVNKLKKWIKEKEVDAIVITGGTGITGRDVTPEAIDKVKDKYIPGFGEIFRYISFKKIGSSSIQSRAIACVSKKTFIFSLPGSPGACRDAWKNILVYQLDNRNRPCNLVDLMPRLLEK